MLSLASLLVVLSTFLIVAKQQEQRIKKAVLLSLSSLLKA